MRKKASASDRRGIRGIWVVDGLCGHPPEGHVTLEAEPLPPSPRCSAVIPATCLHAPHVHVRHVTRMWPIEPAEAAVTSRPGSRRTCSPCPPPSLWGAPAAMLPGPSGSPGARPTPTAAPGPWRPGPEPLGQAAPEPQGAETAGDSRRQSELLALASVTAAGSWLCGTPPTCTPHLPQNRLQPPCVMTGHASEHLHQEQPFSSVPPAPRGRGCPQRPRAEINPCCDPSSGAGRQAAPQG